MQERLDLYSGVHKGLRNAMQATLLRLGQLDPNDATDVSDVLAQLRDVLTWAEEHLDIEERYVHTAIDRKRPGGSVSHARDDHEAHKRDFSLLKGDAAALEQAANEPPHVRKQRARQLYLSWSRFVGDNFVHMAFEETEMNALLWELFTDAELAEFLGAIISRETPEQLNRSTRWTLPALDPASRAYLVNKARPNIPEPVFMQLLSGMRAVLSPRDFAKLEEALGLAA